jgi:hypothetical protein
VNTLRWWVDETSQRERAVEMMTKHVQEQRGRQTADMYRADLEYLDAALVAFADEWGQS